MANKRIFLGIGALCLLAVAIGIFLIEHDIKSKKTVENDTTLQKQIETTKITPPSKTEAEKHTIACDLYSNSPYYIPFSAISEIAQLSPTNKDILDMLLENAQGFYFLKQNKATGEIFILLQNPAKINNNYIRHGLQTADITKDGHISYSNIGYTGEENEIDNVENITDHWEFDSSIEPNRPLKHTIYDKSKKVMFEESWNYNETEPIKYLMKDSKGNIISIFKETIDNNSNYRREHIFYNSEGNITKSITINYEGADIKWFTYFDSENPDKNITIESIYENGLKIEEKIYNQEFKQINSLKATYADGEKREMFLLDSEGQEIEHCIAR